MSVEERLYETNVNVGRASSGLRPTYVFFVLSERKWFPWLPDRQHEIDVFTLFFFLSLTHVYSEMCKSNTTSTRKRRMQETPMKRRTTMMAATMKVNSSILPDSKSKRFEIEGHYWPRVLVRQSPVSKKGKAAKALPRRMKTDRYHKKQSQLSTKTEVVLPKVSCADTPTLITEDRSPAQKSLFSDQQCDNETIFVPLNLLRKSQHRSKSRSLRNPSKALRVPC